MNKERIEKAAKQFIGDGDISIETLGNGLIHHTYKINNKETSIVLQAINKTVFKKPEDILYNYYNVYQYLKNENSSISIPEPLTALDGQLYWIDEEDNFWRANAFVTNSYSPDIADNEQAAYTVAKSFAVFTHELSGLDVKGLKMIIPHFHDLSFRYHQLEDAIAKSTIERLLKATHVISELRDRKQMVNWYDSIKENENYPDRVMHHDCKISNILFNKSSAEVICPVDLDTVMPGKFFSDLGDMIRSMACTIDENSTKWEDIDIRPSFYKAIMKGYMEGAGDIFSDEEKKHMNYAGLIMIYMQAIRFLADFLHGDIYYKTNYPEQNLNRALNQLILLEKLETFLQ